MSHVLNTPSVPVQHAATVQAMPPAPASFAASSQLGALSQRQPNPELSVPPSLALSLQFTTQSTVPVDMESAEHHATISTDSHSTNTSSIAATTSAPSESGQANKDQHTDVQQPVQISPFEPRYFSEIGKIALGAETDCKNCTKDVRTIKTLKAAISNLLKKSSPDLDEDYLAQCEKMLKKNVLDDQCEKCPTVDNEKRQIHRIDRFTRTYFPADGTINKCPMLHLDEYPDMEGDMIMGPINELVAARQLVSRLEGEVATLRSAKESLSDELRSKDNAITADQARATERFRQLRVTSSKREESLTAALDAANARAENAELEVAKLTSELENVMSLLKRSENEVAGLRVELSQQQQLLSGLERESNEHKQQQEHLQAEVDQQNSQLSEMRKSNSDMMAAFEKLQRQFVEFTGAGTMKNDAEAMGVSVEPSPIIDQIEDGNNVLISLCPPEAGTLTIEAEFLPQPPKISTPQARYVSREKHFSIRTMLNWVLIGLFLSVLLSQSFKLPLKPTRLNVDYDIPQSGSLISNEKLLNATQCEWDYIYQPASLTGPIYPTPHPLPLTSDDYTFDKFVKYVQNNRLKVASNAAASFTLRVAYYYAPAIYSVYIQF